MARRRRGAYLDRGQAERRGALYALRGGRVRRQKWHARSSHRPHGAGQLLVCPWPELLLDRRGGEGDALSKKSAPRSRAIRTRTPIAPGPGRTATALPPTSRGRCPSWASACRRPRSGRIFCPVARWSRERRAAPGFSYRCTVSPAFSSLSRRASNQPARPVDRDRCRFSGAETAGDRPPRVSTAHCRDIRLTIRSAAP